MFNPLVGECQFLCNLHRLPSGDSAVELVRIRGDRFALADVFRRLCSFMSGSAAPPPAAAPPHSSSSSSSAMPDSKPDPLVDYEAVEAKSLSMLLRSENPDLVAEGASWVAKTSCSAQGIAFLNKHGLVDGLVRVLERSTIGSSCHTMAVIALQNLASCPECASVLVARGVPTTLSRICKATCSPEMVQVRRAAAKALARLAPVGSCAADLTKARIVDELRALAATCPDSKFRQTAAEAVKALEG
jgi:hypothetical protein